MTQRALSSRSWGMSSGTSRILHDRSGVLDPVVLFLLVVFALAEAAGTHITPARAPASSMDTTLLLTFISTSPWFQSGQVNGKLAEPRL